MISKDVFEKMAAKYGDVGSWAVWEDVGDKPKSNMGHMNIFDLDKNPNLLNTLTNQVIMVGLNFSRPLIPSDPFKNFHDLNPRAQDFKIRYAFKNTEYYGAWMTDVIKYKEEVDSNKLIKEIRNDQNFIKENIQSFRNEIFDLGSIKPLILAFGVESYKLLKTHLDSSEYSNLIQLTHYSHQISKEDYKVNVYKQLNIALDKD